MPAFFDPHAQIPEAIHDRVIPALDELAQNPDRLKRALERRFDRDEPPRYDSDDDTDLEYESQWHEALMRPHEVIIEEYKDVIEAPLDEQTAGFAVLRLRDLYKPGPRYNSELNRERALLTQHLSARGPNDPEAQRFLNGGLKGEHKRTILARHVIKKRWQRMGVWDSTWGIPQRLNPQHQENMRRTWGPHWAVYEDLDAPKPDNTRYWKWPFDPDPPDYGPDHPAKKAVQSRIGFKFGEHHNPPPPQPSAANDVSMEQAQSFITSRPWFRYWQESTELENRKNRIALRNLGRRLQRQPDRVREMWKERGHWDEDWERGKESYVTGGPVPSWWWPNECSSPEPDDLYNFDDLTPSEKDAMEEAETWEEPKTPIFIGPVRVNPKLLAEWGGSIFGPKKTNPPPPEDAQPPPKKRRKSQPKAENEAVEPRRSARVAANAHRPAPVAQVPAPAQPKKRASAAKARPVPARPPTEETAKRTRGRQAKTGAPAAATSSRGHGIKGVEKVKTTGAKRARKPITKPAAAMADAVAGEDAHVRRSGRLRS